MKIKDPVSPRHLHNPTLCDILSSTCCTVEHHGMFYEALEAFQQVVGKIDGRFDRKLPLGILWWDINVVVHTLKDAEFSS